MNQEAMNKELFIQCINAIEQQMKYDQEVAENLGKAFPDAFNGNLLPKNHFLQNALIQVLQEEMNDTTADSWIEYYLWETNFGKESYRLKVWVNNRLIHLKTPEDLYDLLIGKPRYKEDRTEEMGSI